MKLTLLLLCAALPALAQTNAPIWRHLQFYYPTNEVTDDLAVYVYSTQDITAPVTTWPLVFVVTNLSTNSPTNSVPVELRQPYQFFALRCSNVWGLAPDFTIKQTFPARTNVDSAMR